MNQLKEDLLSEYDHTLDHSGVNGERLADRLGRLSALGITEEGGSRRLGFSIEERDAKNLVKQWMEEAELQVHEDEAGNVFGRLNGKENDRPAVLSGSHVDTVPNGGHFDGALGVLTALEVAEAWKEEGYQPAFPYEVVIYSDEEGSRFNSGFAGSKSMVGDIDLNTLASLEDNEGLPFEEVLEAVGLDMKKLPDAKRDFESIDAFIEVHIEQGKRLEKADQPVGVVSGIAGPCWLKLTFTGAAGHAGNTPMDDRNDALIAASEFIYHVRSFPEQVSDSAVATVGKLEVRPNGVNVIPGEVELYVDIRDIKEETRNELVDMVTNWAEEAAAKNAVTVDKQVTSRVTPVPVDENIKEKLAVATEKNGLEPVFLPSGAAHDAMILGRYLPVAMLFVQSKDGVSHNPKEWSSLNDCVTAVHVLKDALESM